MNKAKKVTTANPDQNWIVSQSHSWTDPEKTPPYLQLWMKKCVCDWCPLVVELFICLCTHSLWSHLSPKSYSHSEVDSVNKQYTLPPQGENEEMDRARKRKREKGHGDLNTISTGRGVPYKALSRLNRVCSQAVHNLCQLRLSLLSLKVSRSCSSSFKHSKIYRNTPQYGFTTLEALQTFDSHSIFFPIYFFHSSEMIFVKKKINKRALIPLKWICYFVDNLTTVSKSYCNVTENVLIEFASQSQTYMQLWQY